MTLTEAGRSAAASGALERADTSGSGSLSARLLPPFRSASEYPDAGDDWSRLNLSESSFGCSPLARQAVAEELGRIHRYPDPGAGALRAKLAQLHALTDDHVVVGNGVDELLLLSALALRRPDTGVVVSANTYPGHAYAAGAACRPPSRIPVPGMRVDVAGIIDRMRAGSLVYVCNPHNPAGTALTGTEIDALAVAAAERDAIVVFDEAYIEYASPGETATATGHVRCGRPVVVLRSFSKIYALAGLRCGYALADPALCDEMRRLKNVLVYNVNRLALVAAKATLNHAAFRDDVRDQTRANLSAFQHWLASEPWADTVPSVTNFALVELPWPAEIVTAKLTHRRVLVRDCSDLGLPYHVRVSVGSPHEMEAAKAALRQVAAQLSGSRTTRAGGPNA